MNQGQEAFFEEEESGEVLRKFERMLREHERYFFDVHEFEDIIDHYLDKSNFKNAMEAVKLASHQHPGSTAILLKKAQVYFQKGQASRCMQVLNELEKLEPGNHEIYILKGNALILMNRLEEAISQFDYALALPGADHGDLLYQIYLSLDHFGHNLLSVKYLRQAWEREPDNTALLYDLASACERIDQLEESASFYEQYLDAEPFSESGWYNLGMVYNRLEKFDKAVEAYDYAIAINDRYAAAYFNKGNSLANSGDYFAAIEVYREYMNLEDDNESAYCYLAECFEKTAQYDEALKHYRKALKIDPYYPDAWCGIGVVYMLQDKLYESLFYLKKAIKLEDSNSEFWFYLAEVNEKLEFFEDAREAYRKTTELDPYDTDAWLNLAERIFREGETELATQTLQEAYEYNYDDAHIIFRLAGLYLSQHKLDPGLSLFEIGLSRDYHAFPEVFHYCPDASEMDEVKQLMLKYKPD
ncbi:MAG TPA: tetratricopeptide repeat protein [Bacteroidetes bacterium]|nr:tetratricopeptide repeat protein [Bacteroidota bacterium]